MKKFIKGMLLFAFLLTVTACNNGSKGSNNDGDLTLEKIEITKNPSKTKYFVNDKFNASGIEVTAFYSDESTKNVSADVSFSGFDSTKENKSQKITVSYEDKSASFNIEIIKKYLFHDSVTELEYGTDGSIGKGGTYVLFGDFPQKILKKSEEKNISFIPEGSIKRGYLEYLLGSDGNYYVKAEEDGYDSSIVKTYSDGSDITVKKTGQAPSYRYFKVMPIKWRVITSDYIIDGESGTKKAKLLVAENVLTANIPFYDNNNEDKDRTINSKKILTNNYEYSNVRAYLNGLSYPKLNENDNTWDGQGFLQTAFSSDKALCTVQVDNSKKQMQSLIGTSWTPYEQYIEDKFICNNTFDKVFLLSAREAATKDYGFQKTNTDDRSAETKSGRRRLSTDYALANGNDMDNSEYGGGSWLLRSPSQDVKDESYTNSTVLTTGTIMPTKTFQYLYGIVPAICINN